MPNAGITTTPQGRRTTAGIATPKPGSSTVAAANPTRTTPNRHELMGSMSSAATRERGSKRAWWPGPCSHARAVSASASSPAR